MEIRDRSQGWQHAKLTGHENEYLVNELLNTNPDFLREFLRSTGYKDEVVVSTLIGGLHETDVPGVLGKKTKSKTDLKVFCQSGRQINVSIKKSLAGQVYFVRAGLFFQVFEMQFGRKIPDNVKRAIELFWAAADDANQIIEEYADNSKQKEYDLQIHHKSLNADTLQKYDSSLYDAMLQWFKDNAYYLAKLSFAMGAAQNCSEWSEFVWYINLLGENDIDEIFPIESICKAAANAADDETYFGDSNGGTTIQLPFGFVQWHKGQMQFHHNFDKVSHLTASYL